MELTVRKVRLVLAGLLVGGLFLAGLLAGKLFWGKAQEAERYAQRYRNTVVEVKSLSDAPDGPVTYAGALDGDPASLVIGVAEREDSERKCGWETKPGPKATTVREYTCRTVTSWVRIFEAFPPLKIDGRNAGATGYAMLTHNSGYSGNSVRWKGYHGGDPVAVIADVVGGKAYPEAICAGDVADCVAAYENGAGTGWYTLAVLVALSCWAGSIFAGLWVFTL